jgi:hypothetical protein
MVVMVVIAPSFPLMVVLVVLVLSMIMVVFISSPFSAPRHEFAGSSLVTRPAFPKA